MYNRARLFDRYVMAEELDNLAEFANTLLKIIQQTKYRNFYFIITFS